MWGPGAIVHIINILPFASPFIWTLSFKRYNWLGTNPWGNRRNYNRRLWVKLFFGRFNYHVFSLAGIYYLINHFTTSKKDSELLYSFTTYLEDEHRYDEEESQEAHKQLVINLYNKKLMQTKDLVLKYRADRDRLLKIAAFEEYAGKHNL